MIFISIKKKKEKRKRENAKNYVLCTTYDLKFCHFLFLKVHVKVTNKMALMQHDNNKLNS